MTLPGGIGLDVSTADVLRVAVPAAAVALWFGALALVLLLTRPREVDAAPASQALGGDESPALVSFLTAGWTLTDDAAESTLLDLAARGYLELRQLSDDPRATTVHLVEDGRRAPTGPPLTRYEDSVLARVRAVAVDGVVPLTALTFRDEGRATSWQAAFTADVVREARERGLSRRRVPPAAVAFLGAVAVLPALAAFGVVVSGEDRDVGAGAGAGIMVFALLTGIAGRPRGERDTPLGREVAARWLGLRRYLDVDEAFQVLPPASVAVWDRYLAYGDALGMTRVCAAVIDLGLGNRKRVWSSYGGTWHQVRVRYPRARAAYGASVPRLLLGCVLGAAAGYVLLRVRDVVADVRADPSLESVQGSGWDLAAAALLLLGLGLLARSAYRVVRIATDLLTPVSLRGEVLWLTVARTAERDERQVPVVHHLAVDDGSGDRTTAWGLPSELAGRCAPGDLVELTVRRWSRRVTALTVQAHRPVDAVRSATPAAVPGTPPGTPTAPAAAPPTAPAAAPAPAAAAAPALPGVSGLPGLLPGLLLDPLVHALGVEPARLVPRQAAAGASSGLVYDLLAPGQEGAPSAAVSVVNEQGQQAELLVAAHRERGTELPGVGDEAWAGPGWGIARRGSTAVRIGLGPQVREALTPALPALLTAALARGVPADRPAEPVP